MTHALLIVLGVSKAPLYAYVLGTIFMNTVSLVESGIEQPAICALTAVGHRRDHKLLGDSPSSCEATGSVLSWYRGTGASTCISALAITMNTATSSGGLGTNE